MSTLGRELSSARHAAGLSLRGAAGPAEISAAYLQKLEADAVNEPSPLILQRLAEVLGVPYGRLMRLAGYKVATGPTTSPGRPLEHKLAGADLTQAEERAVAAFVDHLLNQRS